METTETNTILYIVGDVHGFETAREYTEILKKADTIYVELPPERVKTLKQNLSYPLTLRDTYSLINEEGQTDSLLEKLLGTIAFYLKRRNTDFLVNYSFKNYPNKIVGVDLPIEEFKQLADDVYGDKLWQKTVTAFLRYTPLKVLTDTSKHTNLSFSNPPEDRNAIKETITFSDEELKTLVKNRNQHITNEIQEHLQDNPEITQAVLIVGIAHTPEITRLLEDAPNVYPLIAGDYMGKNKLKTISLTDD